MSRTLLLMASLVCAVLLLGCAKTENANNNKTAGTEKTTGSAPSSSTPGTTAASSDDKIGVPECDDFIAKYDACVSNKVPEIARASFQSAMKQWRESWKKMADDPATRGNLAAACKEARERQEAALKSYGCTW